MELRFWASEQAAAPIGRTVVRLPQSWTPRMFLAVLDQTLGQNTIVVHRSDSYSSVNGINHLYQVNVDCLMRELVSEGVIFLV